MPLDEAQNPPLTRFLLTCFFFSGLTALVYQVVWLRMLGLVFGHTVFAITTVLAAFMAGLGLGSLLLGRLAARFRDPVRAYGVIEIGIGAYCALTPLLVWLASFAYLGLGRLLTVSYASFSFVQFLLVFALLLLPTTLMGGTLPILSQALARRSQAVGRTVGTLYAVNTFGAVGGVLLAGYGLLPALGNRTTLWLAAIANIAVGVVAVRYSRALRSRAAEAGGGPGPRAEPIPAPAVAPPHRAARKLDARLVLVALGISGAVSMLYEVTWTRALTLVIGSSTYAFSAMLVIFLLGIAGGAALYTRRWGGQTPSVAMFATLQGAIGLTTGVVLLLFDRLPVLFLVFLGQPDSPTVVQFVQLTVCAVALLPSTLLIGATFPCAAGIYARDPTRAGEDVGSLYAANTVGAIVGVSVAGFALIPAIGVHASLKTGIAISLLTAGALALFHVRIGPARRWSAAGAAVAGAGATLFIPLWDTRVMSSGPAIYPEVYLSEARAGGLGDALRSAEVLFYQDGASASVAVTRVQGVTALRVDGKADASTTPGDMQTQMMLGHLPMLLHDDPRRALVIGLGSGVTAGMVARHPVEQVDVVEIEPAVVEASRFFAEEHGDVLEDPRVRLVIADARNFLLTTSERYDVISSEPSNPWMGGIASLFTREFFDLAKRRLKPRGIMAQWVHAYGLYPDDLRMIVRTFRTAFPATSVWQTSAGDFLLLGRVEPAPVDLDRIHNRCRLRPAIEGDFRRMGLGGCLGGLGFFALTEADADAYSQGAALNTDDRLALEFASARALYADTIAANVQLIRRVRVAEWPAMTPQSRALLERPEVWASFGAAAISRNAYLDALANFQQALQLDPTYARALLESAKITLGLERYAEALGLARQVLALDPENAEAFFVAGLASWQLDALAQAVEFLRQARALDPGNEDIARAFADLSAQAADRRRR